VIFRTAKLESKGDRRAKGTGPFTYGESALNARSSCVGHPSLDAKTQAAADNATATGKVLFAPKETRRAAPEDFLRRPLPVELIGRPPDCVQFRVAVGIERTGSTLVEGRDASYSNSVSLRLTAGRTGWPGCCEPGHGWSARSGSARGSKLRVPGEPEPEQHFPREPEREQRQASEQHPRRCSSERRCSQCCNRCCKPSGSRCCSSSSLRSHKHREHVPHNDEPASRSRPGHRSEHWSPGSCSSRGDGEPGSRFRKPRCGERVRQSHSGHTRRRT
jgi:hypothetical protein